MAGTTSTKGTATLSIFYPSIRYPIGYVEWDWTSNATGNVITKSDDPIAGTLLRVTTNPGATAPTDDYDITVTDEDDVDIAMGLLANRDTANTETVYPVAAVTVQGGATAYINLPSTFNDKLELNVTNAGASKNGKIRLYFE